jgi:hypothetical protein
MPSSVITIATSILAKLTFRFEEDLWDGLYDRVEVWRSRLTDSGPWEEVTGAAATYAQLIAGGPTAAPQMAPIVGRSLELSIGAAETEVVVTFTGVDPLTPAQIATQIAAANPAILTAVDLGDGTVAIRTVDTGADAVLRCIGGEAVPTLGLVTTEPGSIDFGHDPRITLISGTERYTFIDPNGSETFFYRTRFRNSISNAVSEYSLPLSARTNSALEATDLVLAYARLVDGLGRPMVNRKILIQYSNQYLTVSGKTVLAGADEAETDETGYVDFPIVRGLRFTMAVAGTQMARDLTAPTDPSVEDFDMFDPALGTDDVWKVQQPNLDFAVRRTL